MIEITREGEYVKVTSPYDKELKENISSLDRPQRYWDGNKSWFVKENDPNQSPDEETNLQFVRRVAKECGERRNWKVYDLTASTLNEIEAQKASDVESALKARVETIAQILPQLPKGILKLVRWDNSKVRLQLTRFLDDKELFDKLYRASQSAFKVQAMTSFDFKQSFGFAFDIDNHPQTIATLLQLERVEFLKKHDGVRIEKALPSGLVRLVGDRNIPLLGIPINSVDMSEINYTSQSWEIATVDSTLYWVAEMEPFISAWVEEGAYNVVRVGGVVGHITQGRSTLVKIISQWELEPWFQEWSRSLLLSDKFKFSGNGWNDYQYSHPSDSLIAHLKKFPDGLKAVIGSDCDELIDRVAQCKKELAIAQQEIARSNPVPLAARRLKDKYSSKAKLIEFASKRIDVKKSWSGARIIDELCKDQAFCLEVIGLTE